MLGSGALGRRRRRRERRERRKWRKRRERRRSRRDRRGDKHRSRWRGKGDRGVGWERGEKTKWYF